MPGQSMKPVRHYPAAEYTTEGFSHTELWVEIELMGRVMGDEGVPIPFLWWGVTKYIYSNILLYHFEVVGFEQLYGLLGLKENIFNMFSLCFLSFFFVNYRLHEGKKVLRFSLIDF